MSIMKKFALLTVVTILAACSTVTPELTLVASDPAPLDGPTDTATPTPTITPGPTSASSPTMIPTSTLSPEMHEYLDTLLPILGDISESGQELDELFSLASVRIEYLEDESWLKLANDALDKMSQGADDIDAITNVPTQAENAHELFKLAADELRQAIMYQHEVIEGDFDSAFTVTEHMQLHFDYMEAAFREIDKLQQ